LFFIFHRFYKGVIDSYDSVSKKHKAHTLYLLDYFFALHKKIELIRKKYSFLFIMAFSIFGK
jgi:hypothetical protein